MSKSLPQLVEYTGVIANTFEFLLNVDGNPRRTSLETLSNSLSNFVQDYTVVSGAGALIAGAPVIATGGTTYDLNIDGDDVILTGYVYTIAVPTGAANKTVTPVNGATIDGGTSAATITAGTQKRFIATATNVLVSVTG